MFNSIIAKNSNVADEAKLTQFNVERTHDHVCVMLGIELPDYVKMIIHIDGFTIGSAELMHDPDIELVNTPDKACEWLNKLDLVSAYEAYSVFIQMVNGE